MESISQIKEILKGTKDREMDSFIAQYSLDERSGVQALVQSATKKKAAYEAELQRTYLLTEFERKYAEFHYICGIDEVGRGPLAGPVCAGAVILPKDCDILYINDSKQLSAKKRNELYDIITSQAVAFKTAYESNEVIDDINIPKPNPRPAIISIRTGNNKI